MQTLHVSLKSQQLQKVGMPTTSFCVSVPKQHATMLESIKEDCRDIDMRRSNIVDAILTAFLVSDRNHGRDVRQQLLTRDDPEEKVSFGISVDQSTADEIEPIVEDCESLEATRSDVVDAILSLFFEGDRDHTEAIRKIVIQKRTGEL